MLNVVLLPYLSKTKVYPDNMQCNNEIHCGVVCGKSSQSSLIAPPSLCVQHSLPRVVLLIFLDSHGHYVLKYNNWYILIDRSEIDNVRLTKQSLSSVELTVTKQQTGRGTPLLIEATC